MPWGPWSRRRCPIGLDLGERSLKLLQLERRGGRLAAVAAAARLLPDGAADDPPRLAAVAELLREMLRQGSFRGRQVVSCLPSAAMQYKNFRLPRMPPQELRAAVEWEARDRLRLEAPAARLGYFDAGEVRQGEEVRQEVILLSVPQPAIDAHAQILSECGLEPLAIDAVPAALARGLAGREPEADSALAMIDVGATASKIVIARGGRVMFFKLIEIGGERFDEAVARHLGVPIAQAAEVRRTLRHLAAADGPDELSAAPLPVEAARQQSVERAVYEALRTAAEELARELALCLRYYSVSFRGRRPETLLLAGGEAHDANLARVLAEAASIQVEAARPFDAVDLSRCPHLAADENQGPWAVAAGLSLRPPAADRRRGAA